MALLSTLRSQPLLAPTALAMIGLLVSIQKLSSSVRGDGGANSRSRDEGIRSIENALSLSRAQKTGESKVEKVAVNGEFLRRFRRIMKIMIPSFFCRETGYMALVAVMMVMRTLCDLWVIQNGTDIENAIISRNKGQFFNFLGRFFLSMIPIALVNNLLKHGLHQMAVCFRQRLTLHLFDKYLKDLTFYKVSNLDTRIKNPDQLLDQDVSKFCTSVSDLYSNLSKPILDIIIYARRLSDAVGPMGPTSMLAYLAVSGVFLTSLRKPLGLFTATEQALEGDFRAVNSRLITHSEEIAFYGGNAREDQGIQFSLKRLITHLTKMVQFRALVGTVDTIVAKYFATIVAYLVISPPFLNLSHPRHLKSTPNELMLDYYRSGRMLVGMAQAVGRLVLSGRELNRLAGFTARVNTLITVLDDLNSGKYERSMVKNESNQSTDLVLIPDSGTIIEQDRVISFQQVPIVTPNRDVLTKSLTFEIRSGMNLLVVGPNGCGKSSLFRILGGLWPLFGGTVIKPAKKHLFYVPQRPYLALGSLRDQLIYPHSKADFLANKRTDDDLVKLLERVQLGYLSTRDKGLDAVHDWAEVLSGGEKQRIAMARLFYHRPQFAILDECTSSVSIDVESIMYNTCKELDITLVTVSHRKSLWKFHEYILRFDGRGSYEFREMRPNEEQFGS